MALGVKANSAVEKKFDTGALGEHTEVLYLRNNYLGPKGLLAVLEMLKEGCPNVVKFDLAGNNVNNTVITQLVEVAAIHPKLEHIYLSDNPLSFNAGMALLGLANKNRRIKHIELKNTKLQDGIVDQINRQLETNRSGHMKDYCGRYDASSRPGAAGSSQAKPANPLNAEARQNPPEP